MLQTLRPSLLLGKQTPFQAVILVITPIHSLYNTFSIR